jgi:exoribonuclease-2
MEPGNIVEYLEKQKVVIAVVLEIKKQRLRVLNEYNREANLSITRLAHKCKDRLTLSAGRDKLVEALKKTAARRKTLSKGIDIHDLWEVLHPESEWIDLETMAAFCFSPPLTADQSSATMRAFFGNRTYFKFDTGRFLPYTSDQVRQIQAREQENKRQQEVIRKGGEWLKRNLEAQKPSVLDRDREYVEILKSLYLFEKESPHYEKGKALLAKAGIENPSKIFSILVRLGVWDQDEDLEILRSKVPVHFSTEAQEKNPGPPQDCSRGFCRWQATGFARPFPCDN